MENNNYLKNKKYSICRLITIESIRWSGNKASTSYSHCLFKLEWYHIVTYVKILILKSLIIILLFTFIYFFFCYYVSTKNRMHMEDHKSSLLFLNMSVDEVAYRENLNHFKRKCKRKSLMSFFGYSDAFLADKCIFKIYTICKWNLKFMDRLNIWINNFIFANINLVEKNLSINSLSQNVQQRT